jgi:hypothetical protein
MASWFETRGVAALLTMRVQDLILRSIEKRCVSKDEATGPKIIGLQNMCRKQNSGSANAPPPCCRKSAGHFIGHLSWKRSWSSLTMVATVFSESAPSASLTTS